MLSKKSIKILSIVLLVVMLLVTFSSAVFAEPIANTVQPDTTAVNGTNAANIAKTALGALKWLGIVVAVGMLIFLGIKYVTSSPEGKANLKGQLGIYVLGLAFIATFHLSFSTFFDFCFCLLFLFIKIILNTIKSANDKICEILKLNNIKLSVLNPSIINLIKE